MIAVITDVHYRMSLALIRTLGENGIKVICCEKEDEKNPPGFYSKYCSSSFSFQEADYIPSLFELCKRIYLEKGEKPVLFCVGAKTSASVSEQREKFAEVASFLIPTVQQLEIFNDKIAVAKLGEKHCIPTPIAYEAPYEDVIFPCVVKPICGEKFGLGAAKRYHIAKDADSLQKYIDLFFNITGAAPIVQKYLNGAGAGCSVLCRDGEVFYAICHKRVREYPISGGPSTCCESFYDEKLVNYAKKIVKSISYSGVAMIEFKYDNSGKAHLLEINPRVWGTFPLTRASSSDFIMNWFELSRGREIMESQKNSNYRRVKMTFSFSDAIAAIGYAKKGKISKALSALVDFINPFVKDGLWEWTDIRPGWVYFISVLKRR